MLFQLINVPGWITHVLHMSNRHNQHHSLTRNRNKVTTKRHDPRIVAGEIRHYAVPSHSQTHVPLSHDCTYFLWAKDPNKDPIFILKKKEEMEKQGKFL